MLLFDQGGFWKVSTAWRLLVNLVTVQCSVGAGHQTGVGKGGKKWQHHVEATPVQRWRSKAEEESKAVAKEMRARAILS